MRFSILVTLATIMFLACGDDANVYIAGAPTLTPTTVAIIAPSPRANPRDTAIALATWIQRVVAAEEPLKPLLEAPIITDTRWRTQVRDAANGIKRTLSERPSGEVPACLSAWNSEVDKFVMSENRMADELLATADNPTQPRFTAALRSSEEANVYINNANEQLRRASC